MAELDRIRDQFDITPYFNIPVEDSFKDNARLLYIHNMVTAFYRRDLQVIDPANKIILDAGCGTGSKTLILATANPGAKIVGIDVSAESLKIAKDRFQFYGIENAEFHEIPLDRANDLGLTFDYINCDEVLYLSPDIGYTLSVFQSILKPDGIIRANLHSSLQREPLYRAQRIWKQLHLMDRAPEASDYQMLREIMKNIKDGVALKQITWKSEYDREGSDINLGMNHLFIGDKGFEMPELFAALDKSNLEFISMVNWHYWDISNIFKDLEELPVELMFQLSEMSIAEQLHLHELFTFGHRLIDFWCGHPQDHSTITAIEDWTEEQWQQAMVHYHPQLRTENFKQEAIAAISEIRAIALHQHLPIDPSITPLVDSLVTSCLLPLIDAPRSFQWLVQRWQAIRAVDPVTWEATTPSQAMQQVKDILTPLQEMGYILLETAKVN
ncbi:class I SAM-dependent methyltransferase [Roseofilum casamattae]|uniref:Class I SAM-dependent methyltransferase n=1 Tax=Roseofilum casamattae BLCC-M143 TaxID=3022442 RepID=A0ABT7BSM0_9CYAN|nr:class I SAM-dependent methyltransferase [Roseofilum casamattae]MDJ1182187.1 class I SAM-dependent methyltransferase [Roseofilum casamattae BLCC-M143]